MVKVGPFLNVDKDYPTKRSKLVYLKKSSTIVKDVASSCQQPISLPSTKASQAQLSEDYNSEPIAIPSISKNNCAPATDEEMPDLETVSSPKDGGPGQLMLEMSTALQHSKDGRCMNGESPMASDLSLVQKSPESQSTKVRKPNLDALFRNSPEIRRQSHMEASPSLQKPVVIQERFPVSEFTYPVENSVSQIVAIKDAEHETLIDDIHQEPENDIMANTQDEEVAEAKLKLILRFAVCPSDLLINKYGFPYN